MTSQIVSLEEHRHARKENLTEVEALIASLERRGVIPDFWIDDVNTIKDSMQHRNLRDCVNR